MVSLENKYTVPGLRLVVTQYLICFDEIKLAMT